MSDASPCPAEWEPHHATWIGWPHNATDWPGKIAAIPYVYGEIVRRLAPGEVVRILVNSAPHERPGAPSAGARRRRARSGRFPPVPHQPRLDPRFRTVLRAARRAARGAGDRALPLQRLGQVPQLGEGRQSPRARGATPRSLPLIHARAGDRDVVLEGGSIDVNGRGSLLTTEECLLDPAVQVRNPGLGRAEIEEALRTSLGVTNVSWLGRRYRGRRHARTRG